MDSLSGAGSPGQCLWTQGVDGYRLFGGASAELRLNRWKATLLAKNRLIMAIGLGVLGAVLVVKGVQAL
jgi:hypothetical protein